MRALVADDHPGHQRLLSAILSSLGVSVEVANDGMEAVAAAKARPFNLILMDVSMPNLDGLAATKLIRAHEAAADLPRANIIMVTSHDEPTDFALSRDAGANGHVAKPLSIAGLLGSIEGHYLELV